MDCRFSLGRSRGNAPLINGGVRTRPLLFHGSGGAVQPIPSQNRCSLRRASGHVFAAARRTCRSLQKPFNLSLTRRGRPSRSSQGTKRPPRELCATDERRLAAMPLGGVQATAEPAPRSGPTPACPLLGRQLSDAPPARFFYRIRFRTLKGPGDPACPRTGSGRDAPRTRHTFPPTLNERTDLWRRLTLKCPRWAKALPKAP